MKTKRLIRQIVQTVPADLGRAVLDQALPVPGIARIDPFLLIHHANFEFKKGVRPQDAGVGPHPHRGFSPVTFIFEGSVQHQDSRGNKAEVSEGGTQWMHAGMGIIHSERPGKEFAKEGGKQEIIQFGVNSPAKHKMDAPSYQPISAAETPKITKDKAIIGVVAGEFEGVEGPAKTLTPQKLLRLDTQQGASFVLDIPSAYNCLLYLLDGEMQVNGKTVKGKEMAWFDNDGTEIEIQSNQATRAILLSGEPIGEPVNKYGPYVMNTQTEIMEAMRDYQMGKMGVLIEEF